MKWKNCIIAIILFGVSGLLLITYFIKKSDTIYYQKDRTAKATVVEVKSKRAEHGWRQIYEATVEYTTTKGRARKDVTGYVFYSYDNGSEKGDTIIVAYSNNDTVAVKKDFITGEYVRHTDKVNYMLTIIGTIVFAAFALLAELFSARKKDILLSIGMTVGMGLISVSSLSYGFCDMLILNGIYILLVIIFLFGIVYLFDSIKNVCRDEKYEENDDKDVKEKRRNISKRKKCIILSLELTGWWKKITSVRSYIIGIIILVLAGLCVGKVIYNKFNQGNYSGYKLVDAIVIDSCRDRNEESSYTLELYSAVLQYTTDTGEVRTYTTKNIFHAGENGSEIGDIVKVRYSDLSVYVMRKDGITGNYVDYDNSDGILTGLAGILMYIAIFVMTIHKSKFLRKFIRNVTLVPLGAFLLLAIIQYRSYKIMCFVPIIIIMIGMGMAIRIFGKVRDERNDLKRLSNMKLKGLTRS